MNILAIETSCDETACAIVQNGTKEIYSTLASSAKMHEQTGGVVPELAARKQVESIVPVIDACVTGSGLDYKRDINAIAVTVGPGLIGSLIVGVSAAKSLSLAWDKPLIPVNHLVGHIYGNFVTQSYPSASPNVDNLDWTSIEFPAVVLVVSGGHTDLVLMHDHGSFEYLGGTVDDAAGEAFDKIARLLGLAKYFGGVQLSKKAAECVENTLSGKFPRPMLDQDNFDFSFSGLKTYVSRLVERENYSIEVICCEFETAVCDVLIKKTLKACKKFGAKSILLGGGVSANTQLRSRMAFEAEGLGVPVFVPPLRLCSDNAVYIASAAYFKYVSKQRFGAAGSDIASAAYFKYTGNYKPPDLKDINADPSLGIFYLCIFHCCLGYIVIKFIGCQINNS